MVSADFDMIYKADLGEGLAKRIDEDVLRLYGVAPLRPEADVALTMSNEVKRKILHAVVQEMLPKSELYEWHVRGENDLATMSFRLDIGLSDKLIRKGPPIRIHASTLIGDEEALYTDSMLLRTVVENLVDKIVHEVAKLERQRREHAKQTEPVSYDHLPREAEWETTEVDPPAGNIRTSTTGSA
jgi:hypothetical protein